MKHDTTYIPSPRLGAQINTSIDQLREALQRRKIKRVVYVHADHFEPWRTSLQPYEIEQIESFIEQTARLEYARKLTLFYKPNLMADLVENVRENGHGYRAMENDGIGFILPTEEERQHTQEIMSKLARKTGHEIQVHVHHEGWTTSGIESTKSRAAMQNWLRNHSSPVQDRQRFAFALPLHLEQIRLETGLPLDRWAFVHGNWALNGSDHEICRLSDELVTLHANGCIADFTFPSPRTKVNPAITEPFTIQPLDRERCYDHVEADPRPIRYFPEAIADPSRVLIWSAPIRPEYYSLDYLSSAARRTLADIDSMILSWIMHSPLIGGTLYIKTHAHSMNWSYWESLYEPVIPHRHPEVQRGFGMLMEAAARSGIALAFLTVSELMEELRRGEPADDPSVEEKLLHVAVLSDASGTTSAPPRKSGSISSGEVNVVLSDLLKDLAAQKPALGFDIDPTLLRRAERNEAIARVHVQIYQALREKLAPGQALVEIGSSGMLAWLHATSGGGPALAMETEKSRLATMDALLNAARNALPADVALPGFRALDLTPCSLDQLGTDFDLPTSAVVVSHYSGRRAQSSLDRMCAVLRRFGPVYVDLCHFGQQASSETDQSKLIHDMQDFGLAAGHVVCERTGRIDLRQFMPVAPTRQMGIVDRVIALAMPVKR